MRMEVPRLFMPDNNRIEQDHLAIRRRVRPMLGFQAVASARVILGGIEMIHMMRKQQAKYACCLRSHHLRSSSICSPHELITLHMPFSGSYS
jgi:hypothetical protein